MMDFIKLTMWKNGVLVPRAGATHYGCRWHHAQLERRQPGKSSRDCSCLLLHLSGPLPRLVGRGPLCEYKGVLEVGLLNLDHLEPRLELAAFLRQYPAAEMVRPAVEPPGQLSPALPNPGVALVPGALRADLLGADGAIPQLPRPGGLFHQERHLGKAAGLESEAHSERLAVEQLHGPARRISKQEGAARVMADIR